MVEVIYLKIYFATLYMPVLEKIFNKFIIFTFVQSNLTLDRTLKWKPGSYWLVLRMRSPLSSSVSLPATPTGHMTPEQSGSPASGSPGAYRRPLPATPTGHVTPGIARRPLPALARSPLTPPASQATTTEVLFSLSYFIWLIRSFFANDWKSGRKTYFLPLNLKRRLQLSINGKSIFTCTV